MQMFASSLALYPIYCACHDDGSQNCKLRCCCCLCESLLNLNCSNKWNC